MKLKNIIPRIKGGPEKKAFKKKGVVPINFSHDDPFWDIGAVFTDLETEIREGNIEDMIIISKGKKGILNIWRGISPITTVFGMLVYTGIDLHRANVEDPDNR